MRTEETELGRIMSAVAHDLRTPLATIYGFGKTIERRSELDEQAARFLGLILAAAADMDRMIENVSTIGHVVSGRLVPTIAATDTGALARAAHAAIVPRDDGRAVALEDGPSAPAETDIERAAKALALLAEATLRLEPGRAAAAIAPTADGIRIGPYGPDLLPVIVRPGRDVPVEAARILLGALGASIAGDGDHVLVRFA